MPAANSKETSLSLFKKNIIILNLYLSFIILVSEQERIMRLMEK